MRKAIENYFKKLEKYTDFYKDEDFSDISNEIKSEFKRGIIPIERKDKTDISIFKKNLDMICQKRLKSILTYFGTHISVDM